jgi:carboxypeptidase C (cathepsin A)
MPQEKPAETKAAKPAVNETPVVRKHEITLRGRTLQFTTTAGMMPIRNKDGETEAHIFYMAYTLDGVPDVSRRRLMFSFNGGPGSSSVWLHLGALGPRRVPMKDDGSLPEPPYKLVVNGQTWLDETDLVFIDPIGTGYSRPVKPDLQKKFSSLNGDIEAVGEFIRMYLTRNNRWLSPLFLVGESYGTTRAAGLAGHLVDRGIAFNGIALVSSILSFQTVRFAPGNDLPYPLILPAYTATAWYHKKLGPRFKELSAVLKEVEAWAIGPYNEALAKGDRLTAPERKAVAGKLAAYTGLSAAFVEQAELRVDLSSFMRELLRDRNLMTGRLDSRLTGPAPRDLSRRAEFDPSMTAIRPPYTAAMYHYVREELGFQSDLDYYILGGGVGRWDMNAQNEYANVSDSLRQALAKNPYMKIYLGMGYYDMATPYYAAIYTLDHMGLPPPLRANIRTYEYEAGHMYYIHVPSLEKMRRDIGEFLTWAAPIR